MRTLIYVIILSISWSSQVLAQSQSDRVSSFKQGALHASAISTIDTGLYSICMKWSSKTGIALGSRYTNCINGVHRFNQVMDIEFFPIEGSSVAVIFRSALLEMIAQPKTISFLKQIVQDLDNLSTLPLPKLSLKSRLQEWYPNPDEQLSVLAILFQDTSPLVAQIYWLNKNKNALNQAQQTSLESLVKIAEHWQIESLRYKHIYGLPGYHSYVPGYIAIKLAEQGVPTWANFSMSYGFNYFYEYLSLRHQKLAKTTYVKRTEYRQHVNIHDVYPAYVSVLTALRRTDLIYPFERFQNSFQQNLHPAIVKKLALPTLK